MDYDVVEKVVQLIIVRNTSNDFLQFVYLFFITLPCHFVSRHLYLIDRFVP
jgi:hypothetical protein